MPGCRLVNVCVGETGLQDGVYCWEARLTTGQTGSCFNGEYDPCCDPNYQW